MPYDAGGLAMQALRLGVDSRALIQLDTTFEAPKWSDLRGLCYHNSLMRGPVEM